MRFILLALALVIPSAGLAQNGDAKAKAEALLDQSRAALGGKKLASLQGLSASGSYRRLLGERELGGDIEFEMLLPDKFMKQEVLKPMPGVEMTRIEVMNGETVWFDSQSSGSGNIVIRQGGGDGPEAEAMRQQQSRAEFARLLIGWLLAPPASFAVEFIYAGKAEAPDGTAEVLAIKGPNNFAAHLFLDQKTHLPLMLSYKGRLPRIATHMVSGPPGNREELEKRAREAQAEVEAAPEVEMQIRFDDYREVGGILFPHRLSKAANGEVTEEWEMKRFKVNPSIKPEKFEKK